MPSFKTIRFTTFHRPRNIVAGRFVAPLAGLGLVALLLSCSGHPSSITSPPPPNVAGAWEFVAASNDGPVTGIEVALKEGQVLVNQLEQPDGQITASSSQISYVSINPSSLLPINITGFGGSCTPISSVNSLGPGSVTTLGGTMTFTYVENGTVFNVVGTLSGDGQSMLNGTYVQSGNTCATDTGGTITGMIVPKLTGNYLGQMCALGNSSCQDVQQDFTDAANATISESSSGALTLNLALTGTDNANLTLNGTVTGNAFSAQGTYNGQLLTFDGYYEIYANVPSLYLVNATNPVQPFYVGRLAVPPQQ